MEILMSRYILEIQQDTTLFKKFQNGSWYPNFDEYRLFLKKQEKNNNSFSKLISKYHLVKQQDHIVETVFSEELDSIATYLERESIQIKSGYGTITCPSSIPQTLEYPTCYISNGIFQDTETLVSKLINYGSFIVGVCDNPNSVFYQENIQRMKQLETILKKRHVSYRTYHHKNHRDKCLVLSYRREAL